MLLVAAGVAAYAWASTPHLGPGNTWGPGTGIQALSDGVDTTRWWQTKRVAWGSWNLTNAGPVGPERSLEGSDPHVTVGFAPGVLWTVDQGQTIQRANADPADVVPSVTVQPGQSFSVVVTMDADRCFRPIPVTSKDNNAGRVFFTEVHADATALGRTSEVTLALPHEWDIPYSMSGCGSAPAG